MDAKGRPGALESILDEYEEDRLFSGSVLVERGGQELLRAARGFAHRGFRAPNRAETRFDTASLTKLFTAAAAFRLVDRGLLGLGERVLDVVDIGESRIPREVTIGQCLTHTSGIADDADEESGEDYEEIWKAKPSYLVRETRDFLPQFAMKEPLFSPGTGCRYNNCAFVLVGLALEARALTPFREIVEREVFRPAGMEATAFLAKDEPAPDAAEGYASLLDGEEKHAGFRKNIYAYPPIGSPDAGAYTTVGDLRRFFGAVEGSGFLSAGSREAMLSPVVHYQDLKGGGERRMGYALEHDFDGSGRRIRYGKDGCNPGVAAIAMRYPEEEGFIAILANQDSDVWALCRELASAAGLD
jgi:CubicO group peptidase (beta-lactamase class C family)